MRWTAKLFLLIVLIGSPSCTPKPSETIPCKDGDIQIVNANAKCFYIPDKKIAKGRYTLMSELDVFADIKNNTNYNIEEITFNVIVNFNNNGRIFKIEEVCKKEFLLFKIKPDQTVLVRLITKPVKRNVRTIQDLEKAVFNKEIAKKAFVKITPISFRGIPS